MLNILKKYRILISVSVIISILIIISGHLFFFTRLEQIAFDLRSKLRVKPADPDIIIVGIDNSTISEGSKLVEEGLGRYPWPRPTFSKVLKKISMYKPKAIVVDVNFESETLYPQEKFSDKKFIEELKNIPDTFFVHIIMDSRKLIKANDFYDKVPEDQQKVFLNSLINKQLVKMARKHFYKVEDYTLNDEKVQDLINYYKLPQYIDGIYKYAEGIGINRTLLDSDNVLRSYQPVYRYDNRYLFSIPLAVAYFVKGNDEKVVLESHKLKFGDVNIPLNNDMAFYLNWRTEPKHQSKMLQMKGMIYNALSFYQVFKEEDTSHGIREILPEFFKDKIVIISPTADFFKDIDRVPVHGILHGGTIIATALDNLINDTHFLKKASMGFNILVTLALIALGAVTYFIFMTRCKHTFFNLACLIASLTIIIFSYIILNCFLFQRADLYLNLIAPVIDYIVVWSAVITVTFLIERDKKSQVENTFSKYVSPQIFSSLLKDYENVSLKAERKNITVLFSDIRDFTSFSEEVEAEVVAKYLNEYFNTMVKVILKHNGTIDKFMGDAIMAFFGAPVSDKDHAFNAISAALDMIHHLEQLNEKWSKQKRKTFNIGVGINSGSALVGNFGSEELMDFTIIGDTVNVASRLEGLNKEFNTRILISAYTYQYVKDKVNVEVLGSKKVKGKSESIVIYEVKSLQENEKD